MTQTPSTAPAASRRVRRVRDDSGTALTEFIIVIPCFILLLYWAEFLSDVGLVYMKAEEASRYALWETAAMRTPAAVSTELQNRFQDLSSPQSITGSTPIGTRSFKKVAITSSVVTNIDAPFNAHLTLGWGSSGGFAAQALSVIADFIGSTVDSLAQKMKFSTKGVAQSTVTFKVPNSLFPGGSVFGDGQTLEGGPQGIKFDTLDVGSGSKGFDGTNVTITVKSPTMLIDTWKAWPGLYASSSTNADTDVYQSYGTSGSAGAAEQEVSSRLKHLAFLGLLDNGVGTVLTDAFTFVGFPNPISTSVYSSNNGPVAMMPGQPPRQGGVPAAIAPGSMRYGKSWAAQTTAVQKAGEDPCPGPSPDRYRSTVPSVVHTGYWTTTGEQTGTPTLHTFTNVTNPYMAEYNCRDIYYLGSMVPGVTRYNSKTANKTAFPACQ